MSNDLFTLTGANNMSGYERNAYYTKTFLVVQIEDGCQKSVNSLHTAKRNRTLSKTLTIILNNSSDDKVKALTN